MRRILAATLALTTAIAATTVVGTTIDAIRPQAAFALDNGLARTPPMGFNDWNAFGCSVDEALITQTADYFVSSGLAAAGYQYVNIDDCWMTHERDAGGKLVPDPVKFPHGLAWLADYVHAKGLKLGIYEDAGTATCAGFPGSLGHEAVDAQSFADWGIDYLKYDNCNNAGSSTKEEYIARYSAMRDALANTGRQIVYSICEWGVNEPWTWAPAVGNLWRTTGDISDSWSSLKSIIRQNVDLHPFAKPGAWNDPDMLEVGNGGMSDIEYRTHFGIWAMLAAPLLIGTDLRRASAATLDILLNKELIAIDQDTLGAQAKPIASNAGRIVFARPLANGDTAVALYNETDVPAELSTTAADVGLPRARGYALRDVWQHTNTESTGRIRAFVAPHGVAIYRVTPVRHTANAAPATTVSIGAPEGSAGSAFWLVRPGADNFVSTTFSNDGAQSVNMVSVALAVPQGWTATPLSAPASQAVRSGRSLTTRWRVLPPPGATAGRYTISASGLFSYGGERESGGTWASIAGYAPVLVAVAPAAGTHYLSDLTWITASNFWGPVEKDRSNGEQAAGDGHTITIGGVTYAKGLGTHANSEVVFYLAGSCTAVSTDTGIDDEKTGFGDATWQIWADSSSGSVKVAEAAGTWQDAPKHLDANVTGAQVLRLVTLDNGDPNSDHTDWAGAQVTCG
jgi:alpha-galactosidase